MDFSAQSQNRSTGFILTHRAVVFFRAASLGSFSAPLPRTMLWRCAPERTGCQGRNGSTRPICPSPCQRGAHQKCKPIMWCATRSNTGFQRLRLIGPPSSEDEPLKLMPLAHMGKQRFCGEAHWALPKQIEFHTTNSCHTDCTCSNLRYHSPAGTSKMRPLTL